jgi:hypothetical protein
MKESIIASYTRRTTSGDTTPAVRPVDHNLFASQIAEEVLDAKIMMIRKYGDADHGTGGAWRFKYRDVVTCWTWPKTPAAGKRTGY